MNSKDKQEIFLNGAIVGIRKIRVIETHEMGVICSKDSVSLLRRCLRHSRGHGFLDVKVAQSRGTCSRIRGAVFYSGVIEFYML